MKTEIIDVLKSTNVVREGLGFRVLNSIPVGKYFLSIQASDGHYCTPRTSTSFDRYNSFELAIFNSKQKWFNPCLSSIIRSFPRYSELMDRADGRFSGTLVFGYVPVDLINDLYLYLKNR